jgi:integrase
VKPCETVSRHERFPIAIKSGSVAVKIYRVRHKGAAKGYVFSLVYSTATGRKVRQFVNLNEAKEEGRLAASRIAEGQAEASQLSRSDRDDLVAARQITGSVPLIAALQEWAKAREIVGTDLLSAAEAWKRRQTKHERILVSDAVDRFIAGKVADGVNTGASYKSILGALKRDLGARYLDALNSRDWQAWLNTRADPVTRNTFRKRAVTLSRWAKRQGYLPREVTTESEMTERAQEPPPSRDILKPADLRKLLHAFEDRPDLLPAIVLSAFCGLRSKEAHFQTWEDIDLDREHVRVSRAKAGTFASRLVPLPACAAKWLRLTPAAGRTGRIHSHKTDVFTLVRNLARARKVEIPKNALRKSWVSYRLAKTQDLAATAFEAGHSVAVEIRNYRELATPAEARAWFAIVPERLS